MVGRYPAIQEAVEVAWVVDCLEYERSSSVPMDHRVEVGVVEVGMVAVLVRSYRHRLVPCPFLACSPSNECSQEGNEVVNPCPSLKAFQSY